MLSEKLLDGLNAKTLLFILSPKEKPRFNMKLAFFSNKLNSAFIP
jgi:hypothetical protein